MKKKFFLVGVIALFSLGAFIVSCSKDDPVSKSCTCTEYADGYAYNTRTLDPESWGAKNCSDLQLKLRAEALQSGYDETFDCH